MLRVTSWIAFICCGVGVATLDTKSIIPLIMVLMGAGYLLAMLVCLWDDVVREERELYEDIDYLLSRENENRW